MFLPRRGAPAGWRGQSFELAASANLAPATSHTLRAFRSNSHMFCRSGTAPHSEPTAKCPRRGSKRLVIGSDAFYIDAITGKRAGAGG